MGKRFYVRMSLSSLQYEAKGLGEVYLSREQRCLLERIAESLGIGESEVLRQAFMEYAKSISLITEEVHGKI